MFQKCTLMIDLETAIILVMSWDITGAPDIHQFGFYSKTAGGGYKNNMQCVWHKH